MALAATGLFRADANVDEASVRFALSETLIAGINLNDARATMAVWMKQISKDIQVDVRFPAHVFDSSEQIQRRIRAADADAVVINILDYRHVAQHLDTANLYVENDLSGQRLILLVSSQSGAATWRDLRGKRLIMQDGWTAHLSPWWLKSLVHPEAPEQFFSSLSSDLRASQVVLPVFFGRAEACITTARSFQTMRELNPQLGNRLKVLETSPDLVANFYAFHRGFRGHTRERLENALKSLGSSVSGKQLMTLFQVNALARRDSACLRETLRVVEEAERGRART